jgi:hypothetical protein
MRQLSEERRAVLQAVCDTVVPSIEHDPDPTGLWARSATDLGADQGIEQVFDLLPEQDYAGMMELIDALGQQGFDRVSQLSREQILRNVALSGPEAAAGVSTLRPGRTRTGPPSDTPGRPALPRPRRRRSSRSCPTAASWSSRRTCASSGPARAAV